MSIAEPVIVTEHTESKDADAKFQSISSIQYSWTVLAGLLLFWIIIGALYFAVLRNTGGKFIYAIDDAYVSASIGKNLAQHGVWGVTPYEFTSSSSSIIWPVLLSIFDLVTRLPEYAGFILNVALGTVLIGFFFFLLRRTEPRAPSAYLFAFLAALILFVPLSALVFVGLEHILHTIAALGFAYFASVELANEVSQDKTAKALLAFAMLTTLVRFEGMFMVAVVAALFLLRRRWRHCAQVLGLGFAPVVIYGMCAKAAGWFFLPSSVLAKSDDPGNVVSRILSFNSYNKIFLPSELQVLVVLAAIFFLAKILQTGWLWERKTLLLVIFVSTTVIHLRAARTGSFFRYEAYLVGLGVFAIGCALYEHFERIHSAWDAGSLVVCSLMLFVLWNEGDFLFLRATRGLSQVPLAAKNTYEQQYQMARFLAGYYPGAVVIVNDIGAVNFFADVHSIDLAGLGTKEITKLILEQRFRPETIGPLAKEKNARIAIVYAEWYGRAGGLPQDWVKAGSWTVNGNVVQGNDKVSFFAIQPDEQIPLTEHLREFSSQLPRSVHQEGPYLAVR
jgi:hypothetical protein